MSASNHKDTYQATGVFLVLMGILYLLDKWIGFSSHGLPWVMQKDTMLLYAAVIFLWFKSDKSDWSLPCWDKCLPTCFRWPCCLWE